jgi:arylsulfatase
LIDIMATCVDVSGAKYPVAYKEEKLTPLEGKSLSPIFQTGTRDGHEFIFWEHEGNRAVRAGKWKIVSKFPGDWELYDIAADRTESTNIIGKHPDVAKRLTAAYDNWTKRANVVPWGELQKHRRQRNKKGKKTKGR